MSKLDHMGIRFLAPVDGEEGSGGGAGNGQGENQNGSSNSGDGDKYTPPASQADLDRIVADRLARERQKFSDYDQLKKDAAELEKLRKSQQSDNEKAIDAAREEGRNEVRSVLTEERVRNALDKSLTGRTLNSPSVLLDLNRSQFVKDGSVDADAVKTWVEANSAEAKKQVVKDGSQGGRNSEADRGSVQAGSDLYASRHKKKS